MERRITVNVLPKALVHMVDGAGKEFMTPLIHPVTGELALSHNDSGWIPVNIREGDVTPGIPKDMILYVGDEAALMTTNPREWTGSIDEQGTVTLILEPTVEITFGS